MIAVILQFNSIRVARTCRTTCYYDRWGQTECFRSDFSAAKLESSYFRFSHESIKSFVWDTRTENQIALPIRTSLNLRLFFSYCITEKNLRYIIGGNLKIWPAAKLQNSNFSVDPNMKRMFNAYMCHKNTIEIRWITKVHYFCQVSRPQIIWLGSWTLVEYLFHRKKASLLIDIYKMIFLSCLVSETRQILVILSCKILVEKEV